MAQKTRPTRAAASKSYVRPSPLPCASLTHAARHDGQDITIPDNYPFQPVKMKFITKVYHPNVSSASGAICLDILKDAWSPVLTLKSTLISLQSLLCSPEPRDPQDAEVAKHYMTSKSSFEDTARYWTMIYAGGPGKDGPKGGAKDGARDEIAMAGLDRAHVAQFEGLGFDRAKVVSRIRPRLRAVPILRRVLDRRIEEVELPWHECGEY